MEYRGTVNPTSNGPPKSGRMKGVVVSKDQSYEIKKSLTERFVGSRIKYRGRNVVIAGIIGGVPLYYKNAGLCLYGDENLKKA